MLRTLRRAQLLVFMMLVLSGAASCGDGNRSSTALSQSEVAVTAEQTTAAQGEDASHSDSIYLSADRDSVEPNTHTEVTFFAHVEGDPAEPVILCSGGAALGEMRRDSATDYSLTLDLFSAAEKEQGYYAVAGRSKSDVFTIHFCRSVEPDDAEKKAEKEITSSVKKAVEPYVTPEGAIKADRREEAEKAMRDVLEPYKNKAVIREYAFARGFLTVTFPSGYSVKILLITEGVN